ncbi:MAG: TatD family hydrolase [Bacteroidetes bacterium]|nr:TatD family hydrolase [Bacteroidota bacterium]
MFIDTHAHLYSEEFETDLDETIFRARQSKVNYILLPNIDLASMDTMLALSQKFANCIPMMGLHPGYVKEDWVNQLSFIEQKLFESPEKYCAVGEIGMDLYWDTTFCEGQKIVFRKQIQWAKDLKLPIAIHCRDAFDEIFEILDQENSKELSGVFHCFTGNIDQAKHILNYGGFKLGIGGVVTYKKSELPEVIQQIDLNHLVLETDAPYLPPVPYRGKRNESSYIPLIAEKLAEIYNCSNSEIAEKTTQNAIHLFQLKKFGVK